MRTTYPSRDLPGEIGFTLELPDGWVATPAPGVSFVAMPSQPDTAGPSSVVASVRRIDAQVATSELVAALDEELRSYGGCTVTDAEEIWIGDRSAIRRRIKHVDPDSGDSLTQIQIVTVVTVTEEVADAITVTATLAETDDEEACIAATVLESLRIERSIDEQKDR